MNMKLKPLNGEKLQEPFMEVPKGHGYLGVLLYDEVENKVQCHVCGELFSSLSQHIRIHNMSGKEYKTKFGLNQGTALTNPELSKKASVRQEFLHNLLYGTMTKEEIHKKAVSMARISATKRKEMRKKGWARQRKRMLTAEMMNKFGTCPKQIEERFIKIVDHYGRAPSFDELYKTDTALLAVMCRRFKSYSNALMYFGLRTKRRVNKATYERKDIENLIRKFVDEEKRLPNPKDTKRGYLPDYQTIDKHFDGWMEAKKYAMAYLEEKYPMEADQYDYKLRRIKQYS